MYDSLRSRAEERVDNKIKFYRNLEAYVIVNSILAVINWIFTPGYWWVVFPVFFWGIGVLISFVKAFIFVNRFDSDSYRERMIQKEMVKLSD